MYEPISIAQKFTRFSDVFQPNVIARMNEYELKLARAKGDFVWHKHDETDEVFLIIEGQLRIDFRHGSVTLNEGDIFVVPRGREHKPFAANECKLMLIEPAGTVNTGDAGGKLTAPNDAWI